MFNQIILTLLGQKEEYLKLKKQVARTPLENSINNIIEKIDKDIDKIAELNQIEYIF